MLTKQMSWLCQAIRRPFNFAIVDEVDSLLIDECKNPMLINTNLELPLERFNVAKEVSFDTCKAVNRQATRLNAHLP